MSSQRIKLALCFPSVLISKVIGEQRAKDTKGKPVRYRVPYQDSPRNRSRLNKPRLHLEERRTSVHPSRRSRHKGAASFVRVFPSPFSPPPLLISLAASSISFSLGSIASRWIGRAPTIQHNVDCDCRGTQSKTPRKPAVGVRVDRWIAPFESDLIRRAA